MKIFESKKQKQCRQELNEWIENVGKLVDITKQHLVEIENDRICGHWVDSCHSVSIFKMKIGYKISIFRNNQLWEQLSVIPDGGQLMIIDYDVDAKRTVSYNKLTMNLSIDGYGDFVRDCEKIPDREIEEFPVSFDEWMEKNKPSTEQLKAVQEEPDDMTREEYADIYLKTPYVEHGRKVTIDDSTYQKIKDTLIRLDAFISPSSFVDNTLRRHLEIMENDYLDKWCASVELGIENILEK